jgi:hypothetical protein
MLSARGDEAQTRGDWLWERKKKRGKEERNDHQMKRRERQEKE